MSGGSERPLSILSFLSSQNNSHDEDEEKKLNEEVDSLEHSEIDGERKFNQLIRTLSIPIVEGMDKQAWCLVHARFPHNSKQSKCWRNFCTLVNDNFGRVIAGSFDQTFINASVELTTTEHSLGQFSGEVRAIFGDDSFTEVVTYY